MHEAGNPISHSAIENIGGKHPAPHHSHRASINDQAVRVDEIFRGPFHLSPTNLPDSKAGGPGIEQHAGVRILYASLEIIKWLASLATWPPELGAVETQLCLHFICPDR